MLQDFFIFLVFNKVLERLWVLKIPEPAPKRQKFSLRNKRMATSVWCVVQLSGPKKKLIITSRGDYPVKDGFPQSLLTLRVNNIR